MPAGAQQLKRYVRKRVASTDRALIHPEKLESAKNAHLSITYFRPSSDNRYVANSLATGGSKQALLHILETRTGENLDEIADREGTSAPFWRADSRSFSYTREQKITADMLATAKKENARVYLHIVGQSFDMDPVVVGRGINDATLPLAATEYPYALTLHGSNYAVALISPVTEIRVCAYTTPVAAIAGGKAP